MRKPIKYLIIAVIIALAGIPATLIITSRKHSLLIENILDSYRDKAEYSELTISYPLNDTLFPPEISAPTFRWKDSHFKSDVWLVRFRFQDGAENLNFLSRTTKWKPADKQWQSIKNRSLEKKARVTIIGVNHSAAKEILSAGSISISTSKDKVGAPLFYREVNLPFIDAVKDPSHIRWRFGDISSKTCPPIVLKNLPVCGNCHSFSADGSVLGMDVDYASDKGSYVIAPVTEEIILNKSKIITWADYKREDGEITYGLLSQVSPDGKYVVSTVKDRSVFVPKPDLTFSQLFFPVKGILTIYCRKTKTFNALPGADDKKFVQSNPSWSPDGKYIIFTRSKAYTLKTSGSQVLLSPEECKEFLKGEKTFLFDLYRIPFNDGKGGEALPLKGASNNGMSNYFAKYSPDGKWIVFCKAKSFSLLQPDSELYIIPAEGGKDRKMRCNTGLMNSWHSWSPNSKWLVFTSKVNSPYTQLFLTHIDEQGNDTPAVLLDRLTAPDRAANIPEFINVKPGAIKKIREQFLDELSFLRAGNEYLKINDIDNAMRIYQKALKLNPKSAEVHDRVGIVLSMQDKLKEAIAHCKEAVRLNPNEARFRYNLGNVLLKQGNIKDAIMCYYETIRLDPDFADPHYSLGIVLSMQNKLEEAVKHYNEAVRLNPDDPKAHCNLGNVLLRQDKFKDAIAHYKEALRLDPGDAKGYCNLGNVFLKQGKMEDAITHYTRAIKLDPDDAQPHYNIGVVLLKQGKLKAATTHFNETLRLEPNYAEAHCNLGIVLSMQGRIEDAIAHYKKALRINPKLKLAQLNLNRALQQKRRR